MCHVLVIEDEVLIARWIADITICAGALSVEIASDEQSAVDATQRRRPDVVISDVDLKQGGRGPHAVAQIQALHGAVPVIFVTGDPHDRQACAMGAAVLAKPVTEYRLAATFRTIASGMISADRAHREALSDFCQVISS